MEKQGKQQPGHGIWTWVIIAGSTLVVVLALFASQAISAAITLTAATIYDVTTYPTVFQADWTANGDPKVLTASANLVGTSVTTVTVSGKNKSGDPLVVRVQLLNASLAVISTGCAAIPGGTTFSNVVVDVVPDVTYSSVARVKSLGLEIC